MRSYTIIDCETVEVTPEDCLLDQLREGLALGPAKLRIVQVAQAKCSHERKECLSTSESGSNTCFIRYRCPDCKKDWTDELLPAEYDRMLAEEYPEERIS